MTQDDIIKLGFGVVSLIWAALTGWIMRHSSRLTRVETQYEEMSRHTAEDRQYIRASLSRIEDKIDRKVDK